ncbi:Ankyrin repeat family protein [Euphorbia peplus]|nr:Ankyrin repeat family protein [Euphorbia peplus]
MALVEDDYAEYLRSTTDGLLVMASIIATASFQIAIAPPGGFWQDSSPENSNSTSSSHVPGNAILYDRNRKEYTWFIMLDTQVFLISLCLIATLLRPSRNANKWFWVRNLTNSLVTSIIMLFILAVEFTTKEKIYANYLYYLTIFPWIVLIISVMAWPIRHDG